MIATALAGRDGDLGVIQAFLGEVSAGGAALLLTGEPGAGKTALLDAAQERAMAAGVRVLRAAGAQFEADVSFSGLNQVLLPLSAELAGLREALWRVVRELRHGGAVTPMITALEHLSFDSWMTGQWDQAQELADECLGLSLTHGYLPLTWTIRYRHALLAAARGAYDAADELVAEMTEWAAPRRVGQAEVAAHHVRSVAALGRGDFADAYRQAAAISPAGHLASHVGYVLWVLLDLVEAAVRTGRQADAAAHVRAMREAGLERLSSRLSLIVAGAAAFAAPRDQARALFETALAAPRADQWPFDLARVRLLFGEWLRRERSIPEARAQLSTAMSTFRQLGARPWQARAGNELRAAGLATLAADPGSPLSPLDRQIAELAAAGLTNKQIGERLYLSHRTVAAHLYQVFPRLGITARAALRDALDALDGQAGLTPLRIDQGGKQ